MGQDQLLDLIECFVAIGRADWAQVIYVRWRDRLHPHPELSATSEDRASRHRP